MARVCARPNCDGVVSQFKAIGLVNLNLETHYDDEKGPVVGLETRGEICGNCSVDLIEWWKRGKK